MGTTLVLRTRLVRPASGPTVHARRQVHALDVGGNQVIGLTEQVEPEGGDLRQHPPLVGDSAGQDPVEGADPIGAHQQEPVAQVVNIPHFAASHGQVAHRTLKHNRTVHGIHSFAWNRFSGFFESGQYTEAAGG